MLTSFLQVVRWSSAPVFYQFFTDPPPPRCLSAFLQSAVIWKTGKKVSISFLQFSSFSSNRKRKSEQLKKLPGSFLDELRIYIYIYIYMRYFTLFSRRRASPLLMSSIGITSTRGRTPFSAAKSNIICKSFLPPVLDVSTRKALKPMVNIAL